MPLLLELRAFVDHILGGPPPMSSLEDELKIMDVIVEIRRMIGTV
jgi:predicted dehydrogenase